MASTWAWLSRRKEKQVLAKCLEHLSAVEEVAKKALEAIEAYERGDISAARRAYQALFEAERRADQIKHDILRGLITELFHPIDREELIRLVLASDDIADYTKAGIRRLLYAKPEETPEKAIIALKNIAEKLVKATELAHKAITILRDNPREAIEITNRIESLEEEVDEIRSEIEEWILSNCEKMKLRSCLVLLQVLESLETATDKVEDLGDVVRSIALLS